MNRTQLITWLTQNVGSWKGPEGRQVLDTMSDGMLAALKNQAEHDARAVQVANAAVEGFVDEAAGKQYRLDPETGTWQERPAENAGRKGGGKGKIPDPSVDDPEDLIDQGADEDEEDAAAMKRKNAKRIAGNASAYDDEPPRRRRPQTMDEAIASLPEPLQNTVRIAQQVERREKENVIARLLQNVGETERPAYRERLLEKSLPDLQMMASLVPSAPPADADRKPAVNRRVPTDDGDVLGIPTIDWSNVNNESRGGDRADNAAGEGRREPLAIGPAGGQDLSDDEALAHLPPSLKARVQQADVVLNRERRRLIEEIVEDLPDEDDAKVIRNRLQHKSLEELRDLKILAGKRGGTRNSGANYFGAAGAPPLGGLGGGGSDEDVLHLPTMNWNEGNDRKAN
jgi:hypothetical protein